MRSTEKQINEFNKAVEAYNEVIGRGMDWVKKFNKGKKRDADLIKLINVRRQMSKLKYAIHENPSAALFGESQVGKSYLSNSLLCNNSGKLLIYNPKDPDNPYDFLSEINPLGGTESTSIVTRFTSSEVSKYEGFPVKIKILKPVELAMVFIDGVWNEFGKKITAFSKDEIDSQLKELNELQVSKSAAQKIMNVDDLFEIKDYMDLYFKQTTLYQNLMDVDFWSRSAQIIEDLSPQAVTRLLSIFWSDQAQISDVFNLLIGNYNTIDYSHECYVSLDVVLRKNNTILDVQLMELLNSYVANNSISEDDIVTVKLLDGKEVRINKPVLCALSREVMFKVKNVKEQNAEVIKEVDILDFPGARSRKDIELEALKKDISKFILRGKVSFLFNKYSREYLISNLLLCNNNKQIETGLAELLNNWILRFVGKTAADREVFASGASAPPPLFIVYTFFNMDLKFDSIKDMPDTLSAKWHKRFNIIYKKEIVTDSHSWDVNWSVSTPKFKNHYMLRDIGRSEEFSHLYEGFKKTGSEQSRLDFYDYPGGDYWADLKKSFVEFPFVKDFFTNGEEAWNESATLNKDGTEYILRNLLKSIKSLSRDKKLYTELHHQISILEEILRDNFFDDSTGEELTKALQKSGAIKMSLDIAFDKDPFFFSNFISKLLVNEGIIFEYFKERIGNIELVESSDYKNYASIRLANPTLSTNRDDLERNYAVMMKEYGFKTVESLKEEFDRRGIDLEILFFGQADLIKSYSEILSEGLKNKWFEDFLIPERFEEFNSVGFNDRCVSDLLDNIKEQFKHLKIDQVIARNIREYVDRYDKIDIILAMIADIASARINTFVNDLGFSQIPSGQLDSLKTFCQTENIELNFDHDYLNFKSMNQEELKNLFETLDNLPNILRQTNLDVNLIKNIPHFSHLTKWKDYMEVSFLNVRDRPTYDVVANDALRTVIEQFKTIESVNLN